MKVQLIELMTLAMLALSQAQNGPMIRGASLEVDASSPSSGAAPWNVKAAEKEANECGTECQTDSDCHQGGIITCGECNFVYGAQYDKACVRPSAPSTPAPTPFNYFPGDYPVCKSSCRQDRDCQGQGGVFNPCYTCGQYQGSLMHHKCHAVQPAAETPVPTPAPTDFNYFPGGYPVCKKSCRRDSDCQGQGGVYNPCYTCGQYQGSLMHHKCHAVEGTMVE